ncbi:MAG: hypothetical protein WD294_10575 [Phycisphaeraceae bacterium]
MLKTFRGASHVLNLHQNQPHHYAHQRWPDRLAAASAAAESLTARLQLRLGTMEDYHALAEFHYLRRQPSTATRVLVLEDERTTPVGRFTDNRRHRQTVGVLVESLPALGSTMRNAALDDRYRGLAELGCCAGKLVNAELRCISRVVVHPQWRSLGLAVRLVRHALATMTTPYTEAMAAMGRVHPFFELAGMQAYPRWPHKRDQRLRDALASAGIALWQLASVERMTQHVASEPTGFLRAELKRWAGRKHATLADQLEAARRDLLCEPVYYLKARW